MLYRLNPFRCAITLLLTTAALSARAVTLPDVADRVTPAWYLGIPVIAYSYFNRGENAVPTEGLPEMGVYVVAPMSDTAGFSPQRPGPRGIPTHMTVISDLNNAQRPGVSHGYLVQVGPNATERTVKSLPLTGEGVSLAPLASHIRVGTDWLPLNSHVIIEQGLREGLLKLQHLGTGTLIWGTTDWDDFAPLDTPLQAELESHGPDRPYVTPTPRPN